MGAEPADPTKRLVEVVQSVLTSAAIVIAGGYAVYQAWTHRDTWQLANIDQSVEGRRLTPSLVWLTTSVKIHNEGKVLLQLPKAKFIIYQVAPVSPETIAAMNNGVMKFTGDGRIIDWPILCKYERTIDFRLEPSESDVLTVDALIPATVRTVKVFTFLGDPDDPQNGWERATVYDLSKGNDYLSKGSDNEGSKTDDPHGGTHLVCPHSQ